ncbi:Gustatory receptor 63c [Halyomorpha halys]|nr:Gustatory receptor 63c [Halyomorpha halys]
MSRPFIQAIESNFVFKTSKVLGIFPFRVIDNNLKTDKFFFLYSLVISICFAITFSSTLLIDIDNFAIIAFKLAPFNFFIARLNFLYRLIIIPCFTLCLYHYQSTVVRTIHSFESLHSIFHEIGINIKNRPAQKKILLEIFALLVVGIILYVGGNSLDSKLKALSYSVSFIAMALCCGQFIFFVDSVSDGFQSCSKYLKQTEHPVPLNRLPIIEKLVDAACRLVSISAEINSIYSKELFLMIFISYASTISYIYFIYQNAISNNAILHNCIPGDVIVILVYLSLVWRLSHCAAVANGKSKEFNTLLYQLMMDDRTNNIQHNNKLTLHVAMQQEVVFSVCGFFNLDHTLMHSMIASATTYLVILIQFGAPDAARLRLFAAENILTTTPFSISFTT